MGPRRWLEPSLRTPSPPPTPFPTTTPGSSWNCDGKIETSVETPLDCPLSTRSFTYRNTSKLFECWDDDELAGEVEGAEDWFYVPNGDDCIGQQYKKENDPSSQKYFRDRWLDRGHDPPCFSNLQQHALASATPHHAPPYGHGRFDVERCDGLDHDGDGQARDAETVPASSDGETPALRSVDAACPDRDADGFPALVDNCPLDYKPGQQDSDLDRIGDACAALSSKPGRLQAEDGSGEVRLSWSPVDGARGYAVYRVTDEEGTTYLGDDWPSTTDTSFVDARDGDGEATYLVHAVDRLTQEEGPPAAVDA